MDDMRARLVGCFQTVFPDLSETAIVAAQQDHVDSWDSVATITLINVMEEEFKVPFDLERLGEFNSFESIHGYLQPLLSGPVPPGR
jgi:acyl carrier protein